MKALADDSRVTGGQVASECAWPPVSMMRTLPASMPDPALCTGTLVHPRVMLYAAHCGKLDGAYFGEKRNGPEFEPETIELTKTNPEYLTVANVPVDWAFAVFKEPIEGIPVIPIAYGCETNMLQVSGGRVYYAGFSNNDGAAEYDLKWAPTQINGIGTGSLQTGGQGVTACAGDSGGPLLAKLPDGSWRTVGIASTKTGGCGSAGAFNDYSRVRREMVAWLEKESGIDVVPCFDLDGNPTPSRECDEFMAYAGSP